MLLPPPLQPRACAIVIFCFPPFHSLQLPALSQDTSLWAVIKTHSPPCLPRRCLRCKQGACRHVQIVGSKTEEPTTLSRVRFDGELEGFLDGARQQRRLVGLSQQGPIPELTAGGEMSDPTCAAVIAARCSSPLPTVLLPDSSACPCGGAHGWQRVLASPASGQPARLFDVTRCTEVEVFSLRKVGGWGVGGGVERSSAAGKALPALRMHRIPCALWFPLLTLLLPLLCSPCSSPPPPLPLPLPLPLPCPCPPLLQVLEPCLPGGAAVRWFCRLHHQRGQSGAVHLGAVHQLLQRVCHQG